MTAAESARRMQKLLNSKPRSKSAKRLMDSLPKRDPVKVKPEEYSFTLTREERIEQFERAKEIVRQQMAERLCPPVENRSRPTTRLRPRARPDRVSRWACREQYERRLYGFHRPKEDRWVSVDPLAPNIRREVLTLVQSGMCALCGEAMQMGWQAEPGKAVSVDHVVPRSLGGVNRFNIVGAHNQCNADKSNDLPTGCEVIWLLVVNARLRQLPEAMQEVFFK